MESTLVCVDVAGDNLRPHHPISASACIIQVGVCWLGYLKRFLMGLCCLKARETDPIVAGWSFARGWIGLRATASNAREAGAIKHLSGAKSTAPGRISGTNGGGFCCIALDFGCAFWYDCNSFRRQTAGVCTRSTLASMKRGSSEARIIAPSF